MSETIGDQVELDNEFGKFPDQMHLVRDVFAFSHEDASRVMLRFNNNSDLLNAIDQVILALTQSPISNSDRDDVLSLLHDEKDVISFSIISRSSVVAV